MARHIDGVEYFTLTEVAERVGVTRQTLWRWRRDKKVPAGRRSHDRTILYSEPEVATIREFKDHLEPVLMGEDVRQGRLFHASSRVRN